MENEREKNPECPMFTKAQAAAVMAVTGTGCMPPEYFMEEVEKKLGRKVFPAEFNNEHFRAEVREAFFDDFYDLCYYPPHEGLILPEEI